MADKDCQDPYMKSDAALAQLLAFEHLAGAGFPAVLLPVITDQRAEKHHCQGNIGHQEALVNG